MILRPFGTPKRAVRIDFLMMLRCPFISTGRREALPFMAWLEPFKMLSYRADGGNMMTQTADTFRSGELTTSGFAGWSDDIVEEFRRNEFNGRIGTDLVLENDSVRVWHMTLKPGERMPVHRHVLSYFWTAMASGRFLQRTYDGTTYESDVEAGLTHFYHVGEGEFALHNLENVGATTMIFCAVELKKESANRPLPI